jgi:hypothetical protein
MEYWILFRNSVNHYDKIRETKIQTNPRIGHSEDDYEPRILNTKSNGFKILVICTIVFTVVLFLLLIVFVAAPFISLSGEYKEELAKANKRVENLRSRLKLQHEIQQQQQQQELAQSSSFSLVTQENQQLELKINENITTPDDLEPLSIGRKQFVIQWWQKRLHLFPRQQQPVVLPDHENQESIKTPNTPIHPQTQASAIQKEPQKQEKQEQELAAKDELQHLSRKDLLGILKFHAPFPNTINLTDTLASRMFQDYKKLVTFLETRKTSQDLLSLSELKNPEKGRKVLETYLANQKCGWFKKFQILAWISSNKSKFCP